MGDKVKLDPTDRAVAAKSDRQQLVVVASMHRSGTSACARLLNIRGLGIAPDLMNPGPDNERGFWESRSLADHHDRFFASVGHAHDSARSLPAGAFETDAAKRLEQRLHKHLQTLPDSGPVLVKDPRISLLLPIWRKVTQEAGLDMRTVVMVRNPLEVAASLDRRNRFSLERSVLLWLRYMVSLERTSRDVSRVFVSYSDLLDDWRGQSDRIVREIGLSVAELSESAVDEGDEFLSRSLQHHRFDDESVHEDPRITPWVARAYDALLRAARGEDEGLASVIDEIGRDLDRSGDIFEAQISRADARTFEFARRQEAHEEEVRALRERLAQQEQDHQRAQEEAAALRDRLMAVEGERDQLRAGAGDDPAALSRLQSQLSESAEIARSLNESLEKERAQSVELRERIAELMARLRAAEKSGSHDEIAALQEELRQHAERHRQAIGIAEGQLARSQEDLRDAHKKLAERDADLRVSEKEKEILAGRVSDLQVELQRRQGEVDAAEARVASVQEALSQQSVAVARLEAQAGSLQEALQRSQARLEELEGEARKALALEVRLEGLRAELERAQSELRNREAEGKAVAAELKQKAKLETDHAVAKVELSRLRAERARAAKAEKKAAQSIASLERELASVSAHLERANEAGSQVGQERQAVHRLETSLQQAQQDVQAAQAARNEYAGRVEQLQSELTEAQSAAAEAEARSQELLRAIEEAEQIRVDRDRLASELDLVGRQLADAQAQVEAVQSRAPAIQQEPEVVRAPTPGAEAGAAQVGAQAKMLVAELGTAKAKAKWLEERIKSRRMPKSKFAASLMKSTSLLRVPALMLGVYDPSIALNPMRSWRVALESEAIRASGLFDEAYYRAHNWDVDLANEDPITHYVVNGAWEGRNPSPNFDTNAYLAANPDVAEARINPLFHYVRHGRNERRPSRQVPDILGEFRLPDTPHHVSGDPYAVRPDDCIVPEAQRGAEFMARFGLDGDNPDFAAAVSELNACCRAMPIVAAGEGSPVCASIVIPVYGQLSYTLNCLHSLALQASSLPCEVIVVDDCSPDDTAEWLPQIDWIRYVRQPQNGGFISSSNLGASHARGQYVVMLNNDTRVAPGWLDEMMNSFRLFPNAGLVGSKLFYPDGSLQEAGGIVWKDGSAWNFGRNDDPNKPEYCYARRVDYISGAAVAVPKWLWDELGGFDGEYYERAYCEDADLAFQIRQRGYETWFQPLSRVIHYEGKTSGTDVQVGEKAYQVSNQARFFERWKYVLANHAENAVDPLRESDRYRPSFCLVVDATTPTPDQDAGSVTVSKILTLCTRMGVRPIFVPQDNFLFQRKYTQDLQRAGAICTYAPFQISIDHVLEVWGPLLDYALVFRIGVAEKVYDSIQKYAPQARFVFHNIDLHYLRMQREARLEGKSEDTEVIRSIKASEISMINKADCAIVHTDAEMEILSSDCPGANIKVLTYMVDFEGTNIPFDDRKDVMFLGGYNHTPNVDAVEFFVKEVWPKVRARLPEGAKFYAVGANPPASIQDLASDDVVVTGRVDELRPYFDRARVFVAPLRYGAGIKGKVATSMSFGVPSVITNIAAEGMGLVDGQEVLVRDEPDAIAEAIVKLYTDREAWSYIQDKAFDFVHRNYSMEAGQQTLAEVFASSIGHSQAQAS